MDKSKLTKDELVTIREYFKENCDFNDMIDRVIEHLTPQMVDKIIYGWNKVKNHPDYDYYDDTMGE